MRVAVNLAATNFPALSHASLAARRQWRVTRSLSAYRVVTLTGPGGIGKTALALKVARRVLGEFDDGGWLVELASLSDPDLVPSAVAGVLGLKLGGEDVSAEAVRAPSATEAPAGSRQLRACHRRGAILAETFVRLCPRTTILTTSREVLRIQGEYVYRVPPLEVPAIGREEPDHILGHSAVELFIARTKALDSDFSSRAANLADDRRDLSAPRRHTARHRICGGARRHIGFEQVAIGLRDRFALLTSGRRTAVPRHRTLRATLDWSYELLSEPERRLLRRLAVFPAGFTLPAAAAVVDNVDGIESRLAYGITSLVHKSLVTLDRSTSTTRWNLLETIRAYALEKLAAHDEIGVAARRHAEYYWNLFELAESEVGARPWDEWLGE